MTILLSSVDREAYGGKAQWVDGLLEKKKNEIFLPASPATGGKWKLCSLQTHIGENYLTVSTGEWLS